MQKSFLNYWVILFIGIYAVACPAMAQNISVPGASGLGASFECNTPMPSAMASELLGKTQAAYNELKGLRATFQQYSWLAALDQGESSGGIVSFMKQGNMRWEYAYPEEQVFLIREHTLWLYQKELNQVVIDKFEKVLISDLPVAFLMGIGDLKKDFNLGESCRNSESFVFALEPLARKGSDSQLKKFLLLVDSVTFLPRGARVVDAGGNTTEIVLSALQPNPADLQEKTFEATFPDGVDITDRREGENN